MISGYATKGLFVVLAASLSVSLDASIGSLALAGHAQFSSGLLTDASSWPGSNTDVGIYGQGFRPSLEATPDPGHATTDMVGLDQFTFFKDGNTDTSANIKLAIVNNFYFDLTNFNTSRFEFVGMSTNTIASTAGLAVGDPYTFEFGGLQLEYGTDYGALFVNDDGAGNLTPIKVSALTADYAETSPGSGMYEPLTNYGTTTDYQYSTSSFINTDEFGSYLVGFDASGDARFEAVFDASGIPGDFDEDGDVDGNDFLVWQRGGTTPPLSSTLLSQWQANYDAPLMTAVSAVPEPGSLAIVAVVSVSMLFLRRWK